MLWPICGQLLLSNGYASTFLLWLSVISTIFTVPSEYGHLDRWSETGRPSQLVAVQCCGQYAVNPYSPMAMPAPYCGGHQQYQQFLFERLATRPSWRCEVRVDIGTFVLLPMYHRIRLGRLRDLECSEMLVIVWMFECRVKRIQLCLLHISFPCNCEFVTSNLRL